MQKKTQILFLFFYSGPPWVRQLSAQRQVRTSRFKIFLVGYILKLYDKQNTVQTIFEVKYWGSDILGFKPFISVKNNFHIIRLYENVFFFQSNTNENLNYIELPHKFWQRIVFFLIYHLIKSIAASFELYSYLFGNASHIPRQRRIFLTKLNYACFTLLYFTFSVTILFLYQLFFLCQVTTSPPLGLTPTSPRRSSSTSTRTTRTPSTWTAPSSWRSCPSSRSQSATSRASNPLDPARIDPWMRCPCMIKCASGTSDKNLC